MVQVLCIRVPRSRYLPVKSTSDLFLVQSNLYSVSRGSLIMNPARYRGTHHPLSGDTHHPLSGAELHAYVLPSALTLCSSVHPHRSYLTTPLIKLGEKFANIEAYLARVPQGIPNIIGLEHLTVAGDVVFGANVTLRVRRPANALASLPETRASDWGDS